LSTPHDKSPQGEQVPRRTFLARAALGLQAAIAAAVAVPVLGVLVWPLFGHSVRKPAGWSLLGPLSRFPENKPVKVSIIGEARDAWVKRDDVSVGAVWVINRGGGDFSVFTTVCPHLGCAVQWRGDADTFVCPCHGSRFAKDGDRIQTTAQQNPAPRGLDPLEWRVERGQLQARYARFRTGIEERQTIG
jgi:Rieske Fe-S protein